MPTFDISDQYNSIFSCLLFFTFVWVDYLAFDLMVKRNLDTKIPKVRDGRSDYKIEFKMMEIGGTS